MRRTSLAKLLLRAGLMAGGAVPARAAESLVLTCEICDEVIITGKGLPTNADVRVSLVDVATGQEVAGHHRRRRRLRQDGRGQPAGAPVAGGQRLVELRRRAGGAAHWYGRCLSSPVTPLTAFARGSGFNRWDATNAPTLSASPAMPVDANARRHEHLAPAVASPGFRFAPPRTTGVLARPTTRV
jgi:hypothetical protein